MASPEFLGPGDKVLIIDDFLARGKTIDALARLANDAGAKIVGVGAVIEKAFEGGREELAYLNAPIYSLAVIKEMTDDEIVFA
jgi:xanthine phosphoribosyltransferase